MKDLRNLLQPKYIEVWVANYAFALGKNGDKRQAAKLLKEAEKLGYTGGAAVRINSVSPLLTIFFRISKQREQSGVANFLIRQVAVAFENIGSFYELVLFLLAFLLLRFFKLNPIILVSVFQQNLHLISLLFRLSVRF